MKDPEIDGLGVILNLRVYQLLKRARSSEAGKYTDTLSSTIISLPVRGKQQFLGYY